MRKLILMVSMALLCGCAGDYENLSEVLNKLEAAGVAYSKLPPDNTDTWGAKDVVSVKIGGDPADFLLFKDKAAAEAGMAKSKKAWREATGNDDTPDEEFVVRNVMVLAEDARVASQIREALR